MTRPILYVLGSYPTWSETFLRQDLALLLRTGLPLRPLALFPGDAERQPEWPEVPCLTPDRKASGDATPAAVMSWLPKRLRARLSLWSHRRLRGALGAQVRQHEAGHLHAEFADLPGLLAAAVAADCGITYSVGVHARDVHQPSFSLPHLLHRARFVTVCNTAALMALLRACPDLADRAHLIPHGVDLQAWPCRGRAFTPHAELRILHAGRFVEKKGIDTLLHAVAHLRRAGVTVNVSLAGAGPLEERLRCLAHELGVEDSLSWLGVLTPNQVRLVFDLVDCLVAPSRVSRAGDRDGVPNIVLEAMAAGVPVVGTGAGSLAEVLSSRTGWPFPAGQAEALAAALQGLARDPLATEARRQAARSLVEQRYDASRLASERAALFQELAE
jgi:glycosyltransferase involved in cell wall biosynthesis